MYHGNLGVTSIFGKQAFVRVWFLRVVQRLALLQLCPTLVLSLQYMGIGMDLNHDTIHFSSCLTTAGVPCNRFRQPVCSRLFGALATKLTHNSETERWRLNRFRVAKTLRLVEEESMIRQRHPARHQQDTGRGSKSSYRNLPASRNWAWYSNTSM